MQLLVAYCHALKPCGQYGRQRACSGSPVYVLTDGRHYLLFRISMANNRNPMQLMKIPGFSPGVR